MLRITKLTDYGVLVLTSLAHLPVGDSASASEITAETHLPGPTVGKILRLLTKGGLLTSTRGAAGGYRLARPAEDISIAEVIVAFEGPIALTECLGTADLACEVQPVCTTRANWDRINRAIGAALEDIPLSEMAHPQTGWRRRMAASLDASAPREQEG